MKTRLKKIGNSKGIIFPKTLIEQYRLEDEVELIPEEEGLLIRPAKARSRESWEEQFKAAKKAGYQPDNTMLNGFSNSFDKKEWTW